MHTAATRKMPSGKVRIVPCACAYLTHCIRTPVRLANPARASPPPFSPSPFATPSPPQSCEHSRTRSQVGLKSVLLTLLSSPPFNAINAFFSSLGTHILSNSGLLVRLFANTHLQCTCLDVSKAFGCISSSVVETSNIVDVTSSTLWTSVYEQLHRDTQYLIHSEVT